MRALRTMNNLSQAELAGRIGLTQAMVSRLETGLILPGPEYEAKIRAALRWDEEAEAAFAMLAPATELTP